MAQKNTARTDRTPAGASHAAHAADRHDVAPTRSDQRGSSTAHLETAVHDDAGRDSWLGTDRDHRSSNVSWGAILAGVVTFLAVLVLLGILAAALGLSAAGGAAVGIWSLVTLALGLAAAGFVAGALAVRGGLLHGLVTWATSLVALLLAVGLLGSSVLGTVGGVLGGAANTVAQATDITSEDLNTAGQTAQGQVSEQDVQQAQQQAQQAADQAAATFEENRDEIAQTAWWTFGGLLIGAAVASLAGVLGARSVHRKETELHNGVGRRVAG